jgi:UDP-glucose 4-epimerase
MRIMITGAFGMIGRALIKELEPRHELLLVDRCKPEDATVFVPGKSERQHAPLATKSRCIQAEIMDAKAMRAAVEGMDAVIHLAASVTGLPEFALETMNLNVIGTCNVLEGARQAGVKRFFCASSINAYGTIYWRISGKPAVYDRMPLDEDFKPVPEDTYSLSKWFNEETCAANHRAFGITCAAFRFAGVWADEMYRGHLSKGPQPTTAWSDDLYQWVHVDDVVGGIRLALEKPDLPGFGVYTLGAADTRCPEPTMQILESFRPDLLRTLRTPIPNREPLMSIKRAQQAFGYSPKYRADAWR